MSTPSKYRPSNNVGGGPPELKVPRQRIRADKFRKAFAAVKEKHGSGVYSWTEGVTRQSARKIARNIARRKP